MATSTSSNRNSNLNSNSKDETPCGPTMVGTVKTAAGAVGHAAAVAGHYVADTASVAGHYVADAAHTVALKTGIMHDKETPTMESTPEASPERRQQSPLRRTIDQAGETLSAAGEKIKSAAADASAAISCQAHKAGLKLGLADPTTPDQLQAAHNSLKSTSEPSPRSAADAKILLSAAAEGRPLSPQRDTNRDEHGLPRGGSGTTGLGQKISQAACDAKCAIEGAARRAALAVGMAEPTRAEQFSDAGKHLKHIDNDSSIKRAAESAEEKLERASDKAEDKASDLKRDASRAIDRASDKAENLAEKASDKASEWKRDASEKASEWKRDASDKASELKRDASDKASDLKRDASRAMEKAGDKASELKDDLTRNASKAGEAIKESATDAGHAISRGAHKVGVAAGIAEPTIGEKISDKAGKAADSVKRAMS